MEYEGIGDPFDYNGWDFDGKLISDETVDIWMKMNKELENPKRLDPPSSYPTDGDEQVVPFESSTQ